MPSNILPGHVMAFQAVTNGGYGGVSLWGCCINGEPGAAIVLTDRLDDGQMAVAPLFVTIPPGMHLELDGQDAGDHGGGGGGPKGDKQEPEPRFENEIERHFWLSGRNTTGPEPR